MSQSRQRFLFAVDPSLTCSGWALFACADGAPLATGVLSAPGPATALAQRLQLLQENISKVFQQLRMGQGDVLVCEGPAPLVLNPDSAVKVEQVRGIFEAVARQQGVVVPGRINPRTVHTELLGLNGRQPSREIVKQSARSVVRNLYGDALASIPVYGAREQLKELPQDIVDALLIGVLALGRIKLAEQSQRPLAEAFKPKSSNKTLARTRSSYRWSEDDLQIAERGDK